MESLGILELIEDSVIRLIRLVALVLPILIGVAYMTLVERKVIASIQRRKGPNVVGYFGMLQPFADALKSTGKFSEYEYFSIKIGEETNRLNEVLDQLMKYYADQAELKKQIIVSHYVSDSRISIGLLSYNKNDGA